MEEQRWREPPYEQQGGWPLEEGSYIGRHWNGDLSLGVSFWVNDVLLNIAVAIILYIIISLLESASIGVALTVLWILLLFSIALGIWQLVGIWRSAEKHKQYTGRRGLAIAAQVLVVLGWIGLAFGTYDWIRVLSAIS